MEKESNGLNYRDRCPILRELRYENRLRNARIPLMLSILTRRFCITCYGECCSFPTPTVLRCCRAMPRCERRSDLPHPKPVAKASLSSRRARSKCVCTAERRSTTDTRSTTSSAGKAAFAGTPDAFPIFICGLPRMMRTERRARHPSAGHSELHPTSSPNYLLGRHA